MRTRARRHSAAQHSMGVSKRPGTAETSAGARSRRRRRWPAAGRRTKCTPLCAQGCRPRSGPVRAARAPWLALGTDLSATARWMGGSCVSLSKGFVGLRPESNVSGGDATGTGTGTATWGCSPCSWLANASTRRNSRNTRAQRRAARRRGTTAHSTYVKPPPRSDQVSVLMFSVLRGGCASGGGGVAQHRGGKQQQQHARISWHSLAGSTREGARQPRRGWCSLLVRDRRGARPAGRRNQSQGAAGPRDRERPTGSTPPGSASRQRGVGEAKGIPLLS